MNDPQKAPSSEDDTNKPSLWQVIKSVAAAAFGVQTQAAHRRDFTQGSPGVYIIVGVVFTVLFVIVLVVIVNVVLETSGVG